MQEHSVGLTLVKLGLHQLTSHWVLSGEQFLQFATSHRSHDGGIVKELILKPSAWHAHEASVVDIAIVSPVWTGQLQPFSSVTKFSLQPEHMLGLVGQKWHPGPAVHGTHVFGSPCPALASSLNPSSVGQVHSGKLMKFVLHKVPEQKLMSLVHD